MKTNVLILGVGGNVSQGIVRALRNSDIECNIIGACISSSSVGLYFCDEALVCPYAADPMFIDWLIQICSAKDIDIVLTGVEENIVAITKNYDRFSSSVKAKFIAPDYDKLMIGQDKLLTCDWLKANGCNYPEYCASEDKDGIKKLIDICGFPVIAKPRMGKGSNGVVIIHDASELENYAYLKNYVFEECVGTENDEYTVGLYTDKNGNVMSPIIMHRRLVHGSTGYARVVESKAISDESVKICERYRIHGPLNVQLRLDKKGRPVCFELNVRFSGTTPMRTHFGFKDVEAMVREYVLDLPIDDMFHIRKGECYRYTDEIYIDDGTTDAVGKNKALKNVKKYIQK